MSDHNDGKYLMQNKMCKTKALLGGLILGGLLGLGATGAMGGLFGQNVWDDDDDYDIEIKSGSIEEAGRILDRLDKFCLGSSYDFLQEMICVLDILIQKIVWFSVMTFLLCFICLKDFLKLVEGDFHFL